MKKINPNFISKENIKNKPTRSTFLILTVSILVLFLLVGSVISKSLTNGVDNLSNRLGADIIVVPQGYKSNIESVLLKGEPSEFYLPEGSLEKVKTIEGIDLITPQLYVATLSADCCSYPVQIIGIDFDSDFLIKSWLSKSVNKDLKDGEVIVGNHIVGENNENIKFFNEELKIVGRLEQTGMGFDATVFVNMNTAKKLSEASERIQKNGASSGNKISTILLKVNPKHSVNDVANKIMKNYGKDGIFAMFSKKFVNDISSSLKTISKFMYISILSIWVIAFLILSFIFTMIVNERKKEFGILRVIGAKKNYISKIIIFESLYIGIFGSLIGIIVSYAVIFGVFPILKNSFSVPIYVPNFFTLAKISFVSGFFGIIIVLISSLYSVIKTNKTEIYENIKENA